jgi:biopolymer transport protein ExbD
MARKTLATIGLTVMVTAIFVSWGTNHWVQTRIFDPVDMPVGLEPGQIRSGEFEINLRESYGISIHLDDSLNDYYEDGRCSYRNLGKYRRKVFRITRGPGTEPQLWAHSNDTDYGFWGNQFEGVPGRYEVEWDVPPGAACLNARHPRLRVSTSSDEYLEFVALAQYPCLFLGGIGAMLALRALWSWLAAFAPRPQLRMFPELVLRNVIARPQYPSAPPMKDLSNVGIVWGSILYVLMFTVWFATISTAPPHGLLVDVNQHESAGAMPSPWAETTSVYIGPLQFYVNGKPTERSELRGKLAEALSKQMVWSVYLEAHPDCTFGDAVYAMDTIQGLGAKVVWITPKIREALAENANH